jgi:hypothetical protein
MPHRTLSSPELSQSKVRPALRRLVESHLPLQPRLRALLSRRRRHALVGTENFADRSELGTEECFRVIDEIAAFAPECVTILTGGEPLCGATSSRSSGARRSVDSGSSSAPTA